MFLADYHAHSSLSPDARDSMLSMALAAADKGITELCFTNHLENCSRCIHTFPPFEDWDGQKREFDEAKIATGGRISLALGAELDNGHHMPDLARELYSQPTLDFVIGSIHSVRNVDDFFYLDYSDPAYTRRLFNLYFNEYIEMARLGYYDVIGHLGYLQRYMARQNEYIDLMEFELLIRELFTIVIDDGKGIEINTSGMSVPLGRPIPDAPVLSLYRSMGGEFITVGSDSHRVETVGYGISEVYDLLRSLGFKYVTRYSDHKPEQVKL